MRGIGKEVKINPLALAVLSFVLNVDGASDPPANVRELARKMYPFLASVPNVARTPEYGKVVNVWNNNKTMLAWLARFYGKFRELYLKQCTAKEKKVADAILRKYDTFDELRESLDSFFRGRQKNYHRVKGRMSRPSRARK